MSYQICNKCVMEASPLSNITFDENGVCNMCNRYDAFIKKSDVSNSSKREAELNSILSEIKIAGNNKQYDCILGISGGFDSTYLAYKTKEFGLRPLVVHFDNGWNSELAVQNVYNVVNKLGFDLFTYVINWEEFKDLQLAYIKASVLDLEIPTDHFIYATLYQIAAEKKIKYILDGNNYSTEFGNLSMKWSFSKTDLVNMLDIHKKFGTVPLKKFPKLGLYQRLYYSYALKIRSVRLLDYVTFDKKNIVGVLEENLNWREPGGKHYESIYTRFYQGYILPKKFDIDKRRMHLSNLIWSGQMERAKALEILQTPTYDLKLQEEDKNYVIKKFNLTESEFEELMNRPNKAHEDFNTEEKEHFILLKILDLLSKLKKSILH